MPSFDARLGNADLGDLELGSLGTANPTLTLDAVLRRSQSTSLTLDAYLIHVLKLDAVIRAVESKSLTLDAVVAGIPTATLFSSELGVAATQLGDIGLGTALSAGGTGSASLTLDSVIRKTQSASLTLDSVLRRTQSASLTLDAIVMPRFTLDAVIAAPTVNTSITLDAITRRTQSASFSEDAVLRRLQSGSLTLDSILRKTQSKSFTLDAWKRKVVSKSLTADAVIGPSGFVVHQRTGPHTGVDHTFDHVLAHTFDRYMRGENLHEVLFDLDCRITTMEESGRHAICRRVRIPLDAVIKRTGVSGPSLTLDAMTRIIRSQSLTMDASIGRGFSLNAVLKATMSASFTADAVISSTGPASGNIQDMIANAEDWNISPSGTTGTINFSVLTHEAADPDNWFGSDWASGWAKFVLTSSTNVEVDTLGSSGSGVFLYLFGPGTPVNANNIDAEVDNAPPNFDYSKITVTGLAAGTYYIAVAPQTGTASFDVTMNLKST